MPVCARPGWWAPIQFMDGSRGRLATIADEVLSQTPDYMPYVRELLDAEKIKAELLNKKWESYVGKWAALTKLTAAVQQLCKVAGGPAWDTLYPAPRKG